MKYLAILSACLFLSACSAGDPAPDATKIYPAKAVVTVDPSNPYAEAVAVAGEDIVGVGSLEALQTQFPPPWDMPHPDGFVEGINTKIDLLEKIENFAAQKTDNSPLILYGYHNLVQGDIDKIFGS